MNDDKEDKAEDDENDDFIETCRVCGEPGDAAGNFFDGGLVTVPVHLRCLAEQRQRHLTQPTIIPMNQPQRYQNRRPAPQGNGRMKEQRHEDYAGDNGQPTLDQHAGAAARGIIKATGVEDTTEIWRALKRAYLAGYADARR